MAFGKHWEWRGFGQLPDALRGRLEALPAKFPTAQVLTDEYLYVPGCELNVKLRQGDLKLKRLLEVRDGLERWLEDEKENYPFPLPTALGEKVATELGVPWREPSSSVGKLSREELLEALCGDGVRVLAVEKSREQRLWTEPAGGDPVTIEVAEIAAPERVTSVGVEHEDPARACAAVDSLGLSEALRRLNYLEALTAWARGETVA